MNPVRYEAISTLPRHWCGDDAFETRCLEAMSLLAPEMERFLIAAVRTGLTCPGAGPVAAAGASFVLEEAAHSQAHHRFNRRLEAQGIDVEASLAAVRRLSRHARRLLPAGAQLAISAACEHLSAILSLAYLRSPVRARIRSPEVERLFATHAQDEIGHRALVFDLMLATGGGGWVSRVFALTTVSLVAVVHAARLVGALMSAEPEASSYRVWRQRSAGLFRLGRWASAPTVMLQWLMYLRPGFHPARLPDR
jgi:predicted metal-dependent hydrolase